MPFGYASVLLPGPLPATQSRKVAQEVFYFLKCQTALRSNESTRIFCFVGFVVVGLVLVSIE